MGSAPNPRDWLRDLQRKQREVGLRYLLALGLRRVLPRALVGFDRFSILLLSPARASGDPLPVRWASPADVDLLCGFGHGREEIERRLERGDRGCVYLHEGRLGAYVWFREDRYSEPDLRTRFRLRSGQIWLYDAMVGPELRGTGLYPRVLAAAAGLLDREGFESILILVEDLNRNSLRSHLSAGARLLAGMSALRLFGRTRVSWPEGTPRWVGRGRWLELDVEELGWDEA